MAKTYLWVKILTGADSNARKKIADSVLEGIEYFNAKFEKQIREPRNMIERLRGVVLKLKSKDKEAVKFAESLRRDPDLVFRGLTPEIQYLMVKGSKIELESLWEHKFGSPALVYGHKKLPMIIIAGPDIMINDSIVNRINPNHEYETIGGFTG